MGGLLDGIKRKISSPPLYHLTLYTWSPLEWKCYNHNEKPKKVRAKIGLQTWVSYSHPRSTLSPPRPNGGTLTWVRERPSEVRTHEARVTIRLDRGHMVTAGRVSHNWEPRNNRSRNITTGAGLRPVSEQRRLHRDKRGLHYSLFGAISVIVA